MITQKKRRNGLQISLICFSFYLFSLPQIVVPQITFEKQYGGVNDDIGMCVRQTPDQGYVICGFTRSFGAADYDGYLIRTDEQGDTLWTKRMGGPGYDAMYSLALTDDSGFLVCGTYFHPGSHSDIWLIRLTSSGDTLWTQSNYSAYEATAFSVQGTPDTGFIVTGRRELADGTGHMFLMKTNTTGDSIWSKTYPYWDASGSNCVITTNDDGYLIGGYFDQNSPSWNRNLGLVKLNSQGDTLWTKQFGGGYYEMGWSVCESPAGGYLAAGYTTGFGASTGDIYLVKTTLTGDFEWQKHFGKTGLDIAYDISTTSDFYYIITGITQEQGSEMQEALLMKLDLDGDSVWTHSFGGIRKSFGYSVRQTVDEGYILCGSTDASGNNIYDVFLVKTNPDGILTSLSDTPAGSRACQVFPNPSTGRFTVKLPPGCKNLIVSNPDGRIVVDEHEFATGFYTLDLTGHQQGLYLIRIITTHSTVVEKLVIQ